MDEAENFSKFLDTIGEQKKNAVEKMQDDQLKKRTLVNNEKQIYYSNLALKLDKFDFSELQKCLKKKIRKGYIPICEVIEFKGVTKPDNIDHKIYIKFRENTGETIDAIDKCLYSRNFYTEKFKGKKIEFSCDGNILSDKSTLTIKC
jgi:hypothetical protein